MKFKPFNKYKMKMKRNLKVLFVLLFAVLLFSCGTDTETKKIETKTEKDVNGYDYEYVTGDDLKTRIYTLENGLKVYLSDNKNEPRMQTMIAVRAGSSFDPAETTGLAHYLEHMMFKGTDDIASLNWEEEKKLLKQISDLYEEHKNTDDTAEKTEIYKKIDELSKEAAKYVAASEYDKLTASIGAKGTNAFTSHEMTVYTNDVPINEFDKWLQIESERFSNLVLRIFHTELETVYEEFNMSQDNDYRKVNKAMMSGLFQKHPYGTQNTLGEAEHLKNPSMVNIHNYFNTYYVPNNMAVIISGDINYEETIKKIDQYFGKYEKKDVPKFERPTEEPIKESIVKEVQGPDAESVKIGYRFEGGDNSEDHIMVSLIDQMLSNSQAGLIDLNLVQKQKVLKAGSYTYFLRDYGMHLFNANPREGQSLEEAKELLLEQIEKIKKGEFEDWLIDAVIKDFKLNKIRRQESNRGRCYGYMSAFINDIEWKNYVNFINKQEKITKEQLVKFANEHYKDNYVVVYKKNGENLNTVKVDKPTITPVEIDTEAQSEFSKKLEKVEPKRLTAKFLEFDKLIEKNQSKSGVEISRIENKDNELFTLAYVIDMGKNHNPKLPIAVNYLPFLGTDNYSAEELQKEFYKIGLEMNVYAGNNRSYIFISGLEETMEKGIKLLEHVLANVKPDEKAYKDYIDGIFKKRKDEKLNKYSIIYSAMMNYAKYGEKSPFTNILSEEELKAVKPNELTDILKGLYSYKHKIFYYGKKSMDDITPLINLYHITNTDLKEYPEPEVYNELETTENIVYFVNYDMVQNWVLLLSKGNKFDKNIIPQSRLYNKFYGDIFFQDLRESKALAYTAWTSYDTPRKIDNSHYILAYIGTQTDKLEIATNSMMELLNNLKQSEKQFELSKTSIAKKIESERITKANIYWTHLRNMDLGIDYDYRKDIYDYAKNTNLDKFSKFFDENIKDKKYSILVMGKKENTNMDVLRKMGTVKELTLEEIFNY